MASQPIINNHYTLIALDGGIVRTSCGMKVPRSESRGNLVITCPTCRGNLERKVETSRISCEEAKGAQHIAYWKGVTSQFEKVLSL